MIINGRVGALVSSPVVPVVMAVGGATIAG